MSDVVVSSKKKLLIKELLQGQEYATQLKFLLKNHVGLGSDGSASVKELAANVLRSFSQTISVMTSDGCNFDEVEETGSLVFALCNDDVKSEDSSESKKRLLSNTKDRRGSYKRRKTDETRTIVSKTTGDIHSWRKYGQKEILNSQFPRSYFRCTRKHDQGCRATKQGSPIVSSERPIVKQEYLINDDITTTPRSVLADDLFDANLWSDFKDFELSKPDTSVYSCSESQNLEIGFGVFSDFSNDLVYFDERHLL
ncbi:unnamed protein product [Vicia faba]|uniref:WRKY domain-containing protein n=1 Tax=Vicia faba TaxID=3906 RepID=A0AAV0ZL99_VICFA|nr:unnamed protein product [Vicia faba]